MTLPTILLGLVIALLVGFLFHILRGGMGLRLLLYLGLSTLGFSLGQWVSMSGGWNIFLLGVLDVGMGIVGSLLALIVGDWVSRVEMNNKNGV